jgi:small multidrug resistance pump
MPDDLLQEKLLSRVFRAAAVYNVFWGTAVTLFPNLFFEIFGLPPINYPFVMSGLGMCIGLYGYGYWVVAQDLRRYPHLVIIGFLGKALGPIGWLWTVLSSGLPLRTMWTNVFNDLIWLPFFVGYFVWYRRQNRALSTASQR